MRLLLDQCVPRSTVAHLSVLGITSEHVGELGFATATDEEILAEAIRRRSVVVTFDADFHFLLARSQATEPSVIRIREDGLRGEDLAQLLAEVCQFATADLAAGAVASATRTRVRIRKLPLG